MDADTFVLALPMAEHMPTLALLVFLGGLSAAASMIMFETVTLSTMVCNDLVMPILLRAIPAGWPVAPIYPACCSASAASALP